jgi:hypothetical protein
VTLVISAAAGEAPSSRVARAAEANCICFIKTPLSLF